jgi:hypothetical protein
MVVLLTAIGVARAGGDPPPAPASELHGARVIVLPWSGSATDMGDEELQRAVRSVLARPEARFYPAMDLSQQGRAEPDLPPDAQRVAFPEDTLDHLIAAVDAAEAVPWNGLPDVGWANRARELLVWSNEVWFVDRPALRAPLLRLYAEIGRAAEAAGETSPPFYGPVDGITVNSYLWLAGVFAYDEPALLDAIADPAVRQSVAWHAALLRTSQVRPLLVSFADASGAFDADLFSAEYRVFVDGLERDVTDEGLLAVAPGRGDVELERVDGLGLSARRDPELPLDEVWKVVAEAHERIGVGLREALVADSGASVPRVDDELLADLAIYARLHPASEVFVVVPWTDATSGRRVDLWRWDRNHALLARVGREPTVFPVRFVAEVRGGIAVANARFVPATEPTGDAAVRPIEGFRADGVPVSIELRAHHRNLIFGAGWMSTFGWADSDPVGADLYPTEGHAVVDEEGQPVLRERSVRRLVYGLVGAGLTRDAPTGLGPRVAMRVGWTNVPHALEASAVVGLSIPVGRAPDLALDSGKRVQFHFDGTLSGGVLAPVQSSLYINPNDRKEFLSLGRPWPVVDAQVGAGWTF